MKSCYNTAKRFSIALFLYCTLFYSVGFTVSVYSSDAGNAWQDRQVQTVQATARADALNVYGGSARHKVAAPGFFRVLEKSNQWWLLESERSTSMPQQPAYAASRRSCS